MSATRPHTFRPRNARERLCSVGPDLSPRLSERPANAGLSRSSPAYSHERGTIVRARAVRRLRNRRLGPKREAGSSSGLTTSMAERALRVAQAAEVAAAPVLDDGRGRCCGEDSRRSPSARHHVPPQRRGPPASVPATLQLRRRQSADPPLPSVAATRESAMASEPQLAAGEDLGAYRIEKLIGRGGMGEVYRAVDTRLGRPVALKLLAPELADDDRFRERFLRESRLAASLDHPNVLPDLRGRRGRRNASSSRCASSRAPTSADARAERAARSGAGARAARSRRGRARRRARAGTRPPRREARQHADRAGAQRMPRAHVPLGLRAEHCPPSQVTRGNSGARRTTPRRSSSPAGGSMVSRTSTRWAVFCSKRLPGSRRTAAAPSWRSCGAT